MPPGITGPIKRSSSNCIEALLEGRGGGARRESWSKPHGTTNALYKPSRPNPLQSRGPVHCPPVGPRRDVTLRALVAHGVRLEVPFHALFERAAHGKLHALLHV